VLVEDMLLTVLLLDVVDGVVIMDDDCDVDVEELVDDDELVDDIVADIDTVEEVLLGDVLFIDLLLARVLDVAVVVLDMLVEVEDLLLVDVLLVDVQLVHVLDVVVVVLDILVEVEEALIET
jgi:hypothetical protein